MKQLLVALEAAAALIDKTLDDDGSSAESNELLQKIQACVPTGT